MSEENPLALIAQHLNKVILLHVHDVKVLFNPF